MSSTALFIWYAVVFSATVAVAAISHSVCDPAAFYWCRGWIAFFMFHGVYWASHAVYWASQSASCRKVVAMAVLACFEVAACVARVVTAMAHAVYDCVAVTWLCVCVSMDN